MSEFKIGDVVLLKSGGPKMTVIAIDIGGEKLTRTSWFAGSKNESGLFPDESLIPVTDEKAAK